MQWAEWEMGGFGKGEKEGRKDGLAMSSSKPVCYFILLRTAPRVDMVIISIFSKETKTRELD